MKQSKVPWWIGAFQVQIQNTFFYDSLVSNIMVIMTFWYTSGVQLSQRHATWFNLPMLFLALAVYKMAAILIDYKFLLPSRMAFNNKQSLKHENAAMESLVRIEESLKRIEGK